MYEVRGGLILTRTIRPEYVTAIVLWWHQKQQSYDPLPLSSPTSRGFRIRAKTTTDGKRSDGNENVRCPASERRNRQTPRHEIGFLAARRAQKLRGHTHVD